MKKIFLSALVVSLIGLGSCSKSTPAPNPNAAFLGRYVGGAIVNNMSEADTIIISAAGGSATAILITDNSSQLSVVATVSNDTFTVATQTINVNGNSVTLSGGGTLLGSNLSGAYTGTSSAGSFNASYTDIKQ